MPKELKLLLRPAVQHALRHASGIRELVEAARWVFVDLAVEELRRAGEKENVSRLAIITGLQRPVVQDLLSQREEKEPSRITLRVASTWRNNKRFLTKSGQPKVLPYDGKRASFSSLVRSVSKDLPPGTVLFDLQRLNLVETGELGIKLKGKGQEGKLNGKRDSKVIYESLARDTEDLMTAALHNLEWSGGQLPNYLGTTSIDNIDEEDLDSIRSWISDRFSRFQKEVERFLATYDLDLDPHSKKKGGKRVAVGLFSKTTQ